MRIIVPGGSYAAPDDGGKDERGMNRSLSRTLNFVLTCCPIAFMLWVPSEDSRFDFAIEGGSRAPWRHPRSPLNSSARNSKNLWPTHTPGAVYSRPTWWKQCERASLDAVQGQNGTASERHSVVQCPGGAVTGDQPGGRPPRTDAAAGRSRPPLGDGLRTVPTPWHAGHGIRLPPMISAPRGVVR